MAAVMISLGIVYFAQDAPFLGSVQIFVYTGAVMMLFVFVLMLVGVDSSDSLVETIKGQRLAAALLGLGTVATLLGVLGSVSYDAPVGLDQVNAEGNVGAIASRIFGGYVWAFEVTGALLITAALGAMVLAHRERLTPKPTQKELSVRRIREGAIKAPLPAPGVFARHNAVDTPALLPDGSPSELSVSRVLTARGQNLSATDRAGEIRTIEAELLTPLGDELDQGDQGDRLEGDQGGRLEGDQGGRLEGAAGDGGERPAGDRAGSEREDEHA
jgi:NADH-quinone oxidoreductase subunit J